MFQSEMSNLMDGISPELLLFGHESEIQSQMTTDFLQDFNDFQMSDLKMQQEAIIIHMYD